MPRGMDERFGKPSEEAEENEAGKSDETATQETPESEDHDQEATEEQSVRNKSKTGSSGNTTQADEEPLNIREDWDSATIYVEPEQSEDIEITFTRLKKQLKREDITLEKNKHFYRGVFEIAFGEHREETKEKIRELAKQDTNQ